jgi:hypothetical protein
MGEEVVAMVILSCAFCFSLGACIGFVAAGFFAGASNGSSVDETRGNSADWRGGGYLQRQSQKAARSSEVRNLLRASNK